MLAHFHLNESQQPPPHPTPPTTTTTTTTPSVSLRHADSAAQWFCVTLILKPGVKVGWNEPSAFESLNLRQVIEWNFFSMLQPDVASSVKKKITSVHTLKSSFFPLLIPVMCSWRRCKVGVTVLQQRSGHERNHWQVISNANVSTNISKHTVSAHFDTKCVFLLYFPGREKMCLILWDEGQKRKTGDYFQR